jgi:hypothetical protein
MALRSLVKKPKLGFLVVGGRRTCCGDNANGIAGGYPVDLIAGTDSVPFSDRLRNRDLKFGGNLGHLGTAFVPYYSEDAILVFRGGASITMKL